MWFRRSFGAVGLVGVLPGAAPLATVVRPAGAMGSCAPLGRWGRAARWGGGVVRLSGVGGSWVPLGRLGLGPAGAVGLWVLLGKLGRVISSRA